MFKIYEGKMLLAFVGVLLGCVIITLAVNPWARVQFFETLGVGEWGYRHLTTLQEKIEIFNDRFSGPLWGTSTYSGFGLFCYGRETIWVISRDPFILAGGTDDPPKDSRANMERVDENTLIFHSREYPITITFTRASRNQVKSRTPVLSIFAQRRPEDDKVVRVMGSQTMVRLMGERERVKRGDSPKRITAYAEGRHYAVYVCTPCSRAGRPQAPAQEPGRSWTRDWQHGARL